MTRAPVTRRRLVARDRGTDPLSSVAAASPHRRQDYSIHFVRRMRVRCLVSLVDIGPTTYCPPPRLTVSRLPRPPDLGTSRSSPSRPRRQAALVSVRLSAGQRRLVSPSAAGSSRTYGGISIVRDRSGGSGAHVGGAITSATRTAVALELHGLAFVQLFESCFLDTGS